MTTETETTTSTDSSQKDCSRRRHRIGGSMYGAIWMIVIGVIFLLNNFGYLPWNAWGKLWPLFIIIPGLFILFAPRRRGW